MTADPIKAGQDLSEPGISPGLKLMFAEGAAGDNGRGLVRMDPADMKSAGVSAGDYVLLEGKFQAIARVLPARHADRGQALVLADTMVRANAGAGLGDTVNVSSITAVKAETLTLVIEDGPMPSGLVLKELPTILSGVPVLPGNAVHFRTTRGRDIYARVADVAPLSPVSITPETQIFARRKTKSSPAQNDNATGYDDIGGLDQELFRILEMVEWPLRRPEMFDRLGIEAPKGVLLSGPPGTGKTLLARAVAEQCDAVFYQINGPEIVSKHYGESEQQLRDIFTRAEKKAPAIIFIDEIDAIAPKRDAISGDRQLERRVVAQLLTLLDGLSGRGQVVVMAATNLVNSLDPALRRPGRFDREIVLPVPDRNGRLSILGIHTAKMPLSDNVSLDQIAADTHGYVGADLAALAREAGMAAMRRIIGENGKGFPEDRGSVLITSEDFDRAKDAVGPSAMREFAFEVPDVKFDQVGGADAVKSHLVETIIWPLIYPSIFQRADVKPAGGLVLAGPPGTGKTLLAKALANEAGVNFMSIRGPQLLNQYLGETERAVRDIFSKARLSAPCVIFFDEIDALAPKRGTADSSAVERVVGQLLTELDGMEDRRGVFVLAATNRPDCLDEALLRPGRLEKVITIPLPDKTVREDILKIHTRKRSVCGSVEYSALASVTDGWSGAELEALCQAAALNAVRRVITHQDAGDDAEIVVVKDDFELALNDFTRSSSG